MNTELSEQNQKIVAATEKDENWSAESLALDIQQATETATAQRCAEIVDPFDRFPAKAIREEFHLEEKPE